MKNWYYYFQQQLLLHPVYIDDLKIKEGKIVRLDEYSRKLH